MRLNQIIQMKLDGKLNRFIQKETGINRKTVAKKWNEYLESKANIENKIDDKDTNTVIMRNGKEYDSSKRSKKVLTKDIMNIIDNIIKNDIQKTWIWEIINKH